MVSDIVIRAEGLGKKYMIGHAAASGNFSAFAEAYWSRDVNMGRAIAFGTHLSVFCAEDVPFPTDADVDQVTAGTFLGRYLFDEYRNACRAWPRGRIAADARTPVMAPAPTLLVSGAFDPVTPPSFAERVAQRLVIIGKHRKQSRKDHGLDGFKARQFGCQTARFDDGVAHASIGHLLDVGDDEANVARFQFQP